MKGVIWDSCGELEKFIPYREEGRRIGEDGWLACKRAWNAVLRSQDSIWKH